MILNDTMSVDPEVIDIFAVVMIMNGKLAIHLLS
ncbi:MAG: hypothetical protein RLZ37_1763 [Actinomycetota bacterium]|jgi:hypothetical protein